MKKNQKDKTSKRALKTKKAEAKKTKPVKPNNDFIMSGAQNFYMTKNSIATQRVLSIDKNGKPLAVKTEYYAKTRAREEAMKKAGLKPGKPIKGAGSRVATFRR